MIAIFRDFRRLVDALNRLQDAIQRLVEVQHDAGPGVDRLEALELSRAQFEAEVQGVLLEAKGKLRASLNSEARERQLKKSNERDPDLFPGNGEETPEAGSAVLPDDAPASEAERVSALRLGLAPDHKAAAVMAKWGR